MALAADAWRVDVLRGLHHCPPTAFRFGKIGLSVTMLQRSFHNPGAQVKILNRKVLIAAASVVLVAIVFACGVWIGAHRSAQPNVKTASETRPQTSPVSENGSSNPFATAADFAQYAMALREQRVQQVEPQTFVPTSSRPANQSYPWKMNIVTTIFWIGEQSGKRVLFQSAWDQNWQANYGGFDNPDSSSRVDYIPKAFTPKQNPFYCALPYNDVVNGQFKPEAPLVIPWFERAYMGQGQSVCWHHWIAIRKGNRTCYAQWEDVGPFRQDHFQYVFGNERPKPNANHGAGLNVSPAIRDYLGLQPTDVTDWQFVNTQDVPAGPWRKYGDNNHFVIARRQAEQKLVQPTQPSP